MTFSQAPVIPLSPQGLEAGPLEVALILLATLGFCLVIASVYKATHRGLTYSQTFQFALVMLGMLGAAVMLVASSGILPAFAILGGFALIRFRTPVKDPKDMAFILFALVVGLAAGARLFWVAGLTTVILCVVVVVLTKINFGMTYTHESIIRLMTHSDPGEPVSAAGFEALLEREAASFNLLSAVAHESRMELTYGVRPRRGTSSLTLLEALRNERQVEHAELFDAKHQVEF